MRRQKQSHHEKAIQNLEQIVYIELAENQFYDQNNAIGFLNEEPESFNFLSVNQQFYQTYPAEKPKLTFKIKLSDKVFIYHRQVYTLFSLIGDIRGFNSAIVMLPTFFMSFYSSYMFKQSLHKEIPITKKQKNKTKVSSNR